MIPLACITVSSMPFLRNKGKLKVNRMLATFALKV